MKEKKEETNINRKENEKISTNKIGKGKTYKNEKKNKNQNKNKTNHHLNP